MNMCKKKTDTLQETTERYTPDDKYANIVTTRLEAAV